MILELVCWALQLYVIVLIVRIVFSWIPRPPEPILPLARGVQALTDPLLNPLRNVLPPIGGGSGIAIDLSPLVLFFGIYIVRAALCRGGL